MINSASLAETSVAVNPNKGLASEIKWGRKFVYAVKRENMGITIDVGRIDETEKASLNV